MIRVAALPMQDLRVDEAIRPPHSRDDGNGKGKRPVHILPNLRLKEKPLIERWQKLAQYAQAVPAHPALTVYVNPLRPEWVLSAHRDNIMPSLVHFVRTEVEDLEALEAAKPGDEFRATASQFKVSGKVPFVTHRAETVRARVVGDRLKVVYEGPMGLLAILRSALGVQKEGLFSPKAQDLDELLDYLEHATPEVKGDAFKA